MLYFKHKKERTLRIELVKNLGRNVEVTVLQDDSADGSLEEAVIALGKSKRRAKKGDDARVLEEDAREQLESSVYDELYPRIKGKAVLRGYW